MTPERWREIEELFAAATACPAGEQRAFVETRAGADAELAREVLSLLGHDRPDEAAIPAVDHALGEAAAAWVADREPALPRRLGAYRLVEVLGEGGMGTVWLAERDDTAYRQKVAIKVSRGAALSPQNRERFRAERQILAHLEHPAIARLLDGGETPEGTPFLVMELVDGEPLPLYAERHGLDTSQRLVLFLAICEAVEHAHRRLIVHRDLKPSNLLVTADGRAKLVDFGIAKLLAEDGGDRTALHQRYYTAGYASPEQVEGGTITTACDVYSLGVVLRELLSGRKVIDAAGESRPTIDAAGERPPLDADLDRDLEVVIERASAAEPERRYGSVEAFADDLRRYLAGLPVKARADSFAYRAAKFARRNRTGLALSGAAVLTLIGFLVVLLLQNARVERERDRALGAEREAQGVSSFLTGMFQQADPRWAPGRVVTARELLDRGAEDIRTELDASPALRAALLRTMAIAYRGLGDEGREIELLRQALATHGPVSPANELEVARTLDALGDGLRETGRSREAEPPLVQALEIRRRRLAPGSLEIAETLNNLGIVEQATNRTKEARAHFEEALAIRRAALPPVPALVAVTLANLAQLAAQEDRLEESERMHREVLAMRRAIFGERNPMTANTLFSLGRTIEDRGRLDEAERYFRQALDIREATLGANHPQTTNTRNSLASLLHDQGRLTEAEAEYRKTLSARLQTLGENNLDTAVSYNNLASLLEDRGRFAEAEELLRKSLAVRIALLGEESGSAARARHNLGRVLAERGATTEGLALIERATAWRRAHLTNPGAELAGALLQWGRIERRAGLRESGLRRIEEALAMDRKVLGDSHPATAEARAEAAAGRGDAGCEAEARAGLDVLVAAGPTQAPAAARARLHFGDCLAARGHADLARAAWTESLRVLEPRFGPGNLWVRELHRRLEGKARDRR